MKFHKQIIMFMNNKINKNHIIQINMILIINKILLYLSFNSNKIKV